MPVAEAQQRISAHEFAEWLAYDRLSPFGPEREDWRAGMVASKIVNIFAGKGTRLAKPEDFMPTFPDKREREDDASVPDKIWNFLKSLAPPRRKVARGKTNDNRKAGRRA